MQTIKAGKPLVEFIQLAYRANQPVLLVGSHGVGKSELFEAAATALRVEALVRDLSLMEPPDLVGMPQVDKDGRTHYAAPDWLPAEGSAGLLVLEELNRCPRYMRGPCLQLLTARQLNDYTLPPGWLPCAAINPSEDADYQVDDLDPALLSRFMQVRVVADVETWADWARNGGGVHPAVVNFVEQSPKVFEDAQANPRAWTYASNWVKACEEGGEMNEVMVTGLAGLVGDEWSMTFRQCYEGCEEPLFATQVFQHYPVHQPKVKQWLQRKRLDLLRATMGNIQKRLSRQANYDELFSDETQLQHAAAFGADLPADLKQAFFDWLIAREYTALADGVINA